MTPEEALKRLRERFATRSFCVHIQDWLHAHERGQFHVHTGYTLSILPGLNGEKCQQFYAGSVEGCVAEAFSYANGSDCFSDIPDTDVVSVRVAN